MRIFSLQLDNFRGFKHIAINLEGKSAVFFGINGVGKTSILRAVDLIYANFIGSILQTKKRLAELNEDDIFDNSLFAKAEVVFLSNDKTKYSYWRKIDRDGKRTHGKPVLKAMVDDFTREYLGEIDEGQNGEEYFRESNAFMPIFVNYGVNRLVLETPLVNDNSKYEKKNAFDNAIESKIDFKSFFSWFKYKEDLENEILARSNFEYFGSVPAKPDDLQAVRIAMLSMFPEFKNVRVDRKLNTFILEKNGEVLNINQLSDGEKCTMALFGDIARRMSIANNGHLENPLLGDGVVLIDEVDLHLHPSWQRKIVGILRRTFPNIQFILTTHSPQVLGGVDKDFSVFSIDRMDGDVIVEKHDSLYGWDSNIILEEAMGTSRVNNEVLQHIERMYQAYDADDLKTASEESDWIDINTSGHNDCVSGMRVMISRKRRMLENAKNQ